MKTKKCPKHGNLKIRGKVLTGKIVSTKMKDSAVVRIDKIQKVPKYNRYKRTHSKITVHVPECMDIQTGDKVKIGETRKLSKTKSFVVMEKIGDAK